jgi:glycosyltransferase involved in cell wall biosynthesis
LGLSRVTGILTNPEHHEYVSAATDLSVMASYIEEQGLKICFLGCLDDLLLKDTGGSVRTYYLAKSLAELGHEVHIIVPGNRETFEWAHKVTVHGVNGLLPKWILIFFSKLVGVQRATSLFLYDLSFALRSRRIILNSDVIQAEGPVSSALITLCVKTIFKKPFIVDCHDTFQATRIKYQNTLRKIIEIFLEKIVYEHAELILTVSEKDKELLIKNGICQYKILVIPNGVDTEAFAPSLDVTEINTRYDLKDFYKVVFLGNMEYLPNQEAANVIASNIAPRILNQMSKVKFLMVGRVPPKILTNSSDLIFTGVVKNVAEFLAASDIAIAPLLEASGTRLKILEYFSCSLPVVSTSKGAEGLDIENGVNILIEDDMEEFASRIIDLLENEDLRKKLGKAARELAIEKYDWRIVGRKLDAVFCLLNQKKAFQKEA